MTLVIHNDPIPLHMDKQGDLQLQSTDIRFAWVIQQFQQGASPEAIVERQHTLELANVYAVIAYYLRHQDEIDEYLKQWGQHQAEVQPKPELPEADLPAPAN
jgi:uncharacterized protein (DUF433 family)